MAYDKEEIYKKSLEVIQEHNLFFIEDVVAYLPCVKRTFYDYFPIDSHEMHTIKELLDKNKTVEKVAIRKKLKNSDKAAELLALYRLLATKEEHQKLNQSYIDHTTKGKEMNQPLNLTKEQVKKISKDLEDEY